MTATMDPVAQINDRYGWSSDYDILWNWVQGCVWISLPINVNSPITREELELSFCGALLEFDVSTNRFVAHLTDDEGSYYIVSMDMPGYFTDNYGCSKEDLTRNIVFDVLELEYVASRISTDLCFWVGSVITIFKDRERHSKSENTVKT